MASKEDGDSEPWGGFKWDGVVSETMTKMFAEHRKEQQLLAQEYEKEISMGKKGIPIHRGQMFKHEHGGEVGTLHKSQKRNI